MLRVTADSNIYISALVFGGNPFRLLELAEAGRVELAISDAILQETLGVLRDKFGRSAADLAEATEHIRRCAVTVIPTETIDVVTTDPDDNRVLECAVQASSDCIISGDQDLLRLGVFRETGL